MADEETLDNGEEPKKKGKLGLIIGLVLALLGGGVGFFAVYTGMILATDAQDEAEMSEEEATEPSPAITFVPLEPLIINVGRGGARQLRFRAELEVVPERDADVALLMPRILDVLNGYLRAVDVQELENPASLIMLRAQMLRRIQIVTGDGHVRDLLITEFVFT